MHYCTIHLMQTNPIIIIGTGLAGYQLAREFRRVNAEIPLTIITADSGQYYSKPQLSTALTNKKTAETLVTASADNMAQQLNATIIPHTTVTQIDPEQQIVFAGNQSFHYDKLVIACGADAIKAPIEGNAATEILSVNHIYHYATFANLIQNKKHITILGAGLIGCEFANDLTNAGYEVHMVAPAIAPLDLLVPEKVGRVLQQVLAQNGVHFHLQVLPKRVEKLANGYELLLSDGNKIHTEFILSAIGLIPHTTLAKTANIAVNRGILVDRFLSTSIKNIYALGDCAEVEGHVLPYITPILQCARVLAKTLAGEKTAVSYPAMPVVVKTPAHPIVICPPPKNMPGEWEINIQDNNVRALFYQGQQLHGFILTNEATKERAELVKLIPALF